MLKPETISFTDAVMTSRTQTALHVFTEHGRRREHWPAYDSALDTYEEKFGKLIDGRPIADLLSGSSDIVVVDYMSSSEALADLFKQIPPKRKKRGVAVSLADNRTMRQKWRDFRLHIDQMPLDVTTAPAAQVISNSVGEEQANLIMNRGGWGLRFLPHHIRFYNNALDTTWRLLNPNGGHFLTETPGETYLHKAGVDLQAWISQLHPSMTPLYIAEGGTSGNGLLKLVKQPESPKVLPPVTSVLFRGSGGRG